ncbi:MAG: DUF5329 family protein [Halobacteriovoraceae bacterium]|nr:DUF5329 family protein [Halobacteriovoraceae bacterium]
MKTIFILSMFFNIAVSQERTSLSEEQKIDMLLDYIKEQENVVFIRNGEEHSAADASDHLGMKRRFGWFHGFSDGTASEFIDKLASESSSSGEKYKIKITVNGKSRVIFLRDFLFAKLKELEKSEKKRNTANAAAN